MAASSWSTGASCRPSGATPPGAKPRPRTARSPSPACCASTEPAGGFLRDNDPAANRWHSRDVAAIAAARGLPADRVAPYFVDAEATPDGQWPVGGLTVLRFSDNHLVYAITWYVLALMVAAAGLFVLRSARRPAEPEAG